MIKHHQICKFSTLILPLTLLASCTKETDEDSSDITTVVSCEISFENAVHHEAEVTVTYLPEETASFRISRTSPGRYAIHEFAKNVYSVSSTAISLPIMGGHAEFAQPFDLSSIKDTISGTAGVELEDDPVNNKYPMPLYVKDKNSVYVGRVRLDEIRPNTINMWVVADNFRKGAATNAVQIAEYLINNNLVNG